MTDNGTQTIQYSDGPSDTTITATDIDSPGSSLTLSGLPTGITQSKSCSGSATVADPTQCTWTLGGAVNVGAGSYSLTVSDGSLSASAGTITVTKENATILYNSGNPGSIPVSQATLALIVQVQETYPEPNGSPTYAGSISNAGLSAKITGVATGTNYNGNCQSSGVTGTGYAAVKNYTCTFTSAGFVVDAYIVELTVTGNYYLGSYEDAVTVYDPNYVFLTGGGKFLLGGYRVSFGLSFTSTKGKTGTRGGLVVVLHHTDGGRCRVKSNSMDAPAIYLNTASFSGKGNYTCVDGLGQTTASAGNVPITGYVEDNDTSGAGADKFWVRAYGELLMNLPAASNAELLTGGNLQVPQPSAKR